MCLKACRQSQGIAQRMTDLSFSVLAYPHKCVCVCVSAHTHRLHSPNISPVVEKCEVQERFAANVDKVHTDMTGLSGNTDPLANTLLQVSLKHTHAHTQHGERITEAGG